MNTYNSSDEVLAALRKHAEREIECNGQKYGIVYLGNVGSTKQLSGYLSALEKQGLYKPYRDGENDGIFGKVRLDA